MDADTLYPRTHVWCSTCKQRYQFKDCRTEDLKRTYQGRPINNMAKTGTKFKLERWHIYAISAVGTLAIVFFYGLIMVALPYIQPFVGWAQDVPSELKLELMNTWAGFNSSYPYTYSAFTINTFIFLASQEYVRKKWHIFSYYGTDRGARWALARKSCIALLVGMGLVTYGVLFAAYSNLGSASQPATIWGITIFIGIASLLVSLAGFTTEW